MRNHFLLAALLLSTQAAQSQTTYLPAGSPEYDYVDRWEAKSGRLSNDVFTSLKSYSRKEVVTFIEGQLAGDTGQLTAIDRYQMQRSLGVSSEWSGVELESRKPVFKHFYQTQSDLYRVKTPNFFLSVNPVLGLQMLYDKDASAPAGESSFKYLNSRGVELRARIANRIGLYTFVTDNQERMPFPVQQWTESHQAVPGADYYQVPKPGTYDYLLARGYIDFAAIKNHVNVSFGYDRNFIGDGDRSLILSDFAASGATFLRLRTRIWKLMYQNLFLELTPQYQRGADQQLPHKYATIHHLSVNVTPWLNIGAFESVVFGRANRYEFSYLNPIIFLRQVERQNGSPDNALLGLTFKAIAAKRLQLYGQFVLDEFRFSELTAGKGWIGNKFAIQAGAKYFDAFGVKNLDLQGELNVVRPFTYSHNDSLANYTHYNQPLAHPIGSGFMEGSGTIRYRPARNWQVVAQGRVYRQGVDTGSRNLGNNIFRLNNAGVTDQYGYTLISGEEKNVVLGDLRVSWEAKPRLFLDLGFSGRRATTGGVTQNSTWGYAGLRLNFARRDYLFQ